MKVVRYTSYLWFIFLSLIMNMLCIIFLYTNKILVYYFFNLDSRTRTYNADKKTLLNAATLKNNM